MPRCSRHWGEHSCLRSDPGALRHRRGAQPRWRAAARSPLAAHPRATAAAAGLLPGTRYFYQVAASSAGPWSKEESFTTFGAQNSFPFRIGYMADLGLSLNASLTVRTTPQGASGGDARWRPGSAPATAAAAAPPPTRSRSPALALSCLGGPLRRPSAWRPASPSWSQTWVTLPTVCAAASNSAGGGGGCRFRVSGGHPAEGALLPPCWHHAVSPQCSHGVPCTPPLPPPPHPLPPTHSPCSRPVCPQRHLLQQHQAQGPEEPRELSTLLGPVRAHAGAPRLTGAHAHVPRVSTAPPAACWAPGIRQQRRRAHGLPRARGRRAHPLPLPLRSRSNHEMEFQPDGTVLAAYNARYPMPQGFEPATGALRVLAANESAAAAPQTNMFYSVDVPGVAHLVFLSAYIPNDTWAAGTPQVRGCGTRRRAAGIGRGCRWRGMPHPPPRVQEAGAHAHVRWPSSRPRPRPPRRIPPPAAHVAGG